MKSSDRKNNLHFTSTVSPEYVENVSIYGHPFRKGGGENFILLMKFYFDEIEYFEENEKRKEQNKEAGIFHGGKSVIQEAISYKVAETCGIFSRLLEFEFLHCETMAVVKNKYFRPFSRGRLFSSVSGVQVE